MTTPLHSTLAAVTARIASRSRATRDAYLARLDAARGQFPQRTALSCANLAHGFAAMPADDKLVIRSQRQPNIGIVTAYNDMLSAHQPYETYPQRIRAASRAAGATAQVAGGVPAMCDGITQGNAGMELSLFSREVIAMSTAVALSHNMFDGALMLGVCDKIVPGLVIGALQFGHLPTIFVPAGPMTSGLSNDEKAKIRQQYATGLVGRDALLEAESRAYHGVGTCTFYGTANSNQLLMEIMGLHLPGAAFIHPDTPLRDALTDAAVARVVAIGASGDAYTPIGRIVDEKAVVNGIVGLLATGGSTNHTLHLVAMARAAGVIIDWDDFDALSAVVPLMARVYPNGRADVNHFHAAGGMAFLIGELLDAGMLHDDVMTNAGPGLSRYRDEPALTGPEGGLAWRAGSAYSGDRDVLRSYAEPFAADGGLRLMQGNLGRGVIKVSAVAPQHRQVKAAARVFASQEAVQAAFDAGELQRDVIVVLRGQGPSANGMPELHRLTPLLGSLQDAGFQVALVTDGRMSGASGKVPAVIHVSPEAALGGPLAKVRDGDEIVLDAVRGTLEAQVPAAVWNAREGAAVMPAGDDTGRLLFGMMRAAVGVAEAGASVFFNDVTEDAAQGADAVQSPAPADFVQSHRGAGAAR
ncbi:phosphogluconate dehydratase [Pandoraea terrae]|nr:phosphogluconate dehydratase [Pandoraea terrae]